ncbi:hypothetical protein FIBSPDRAFT_920084 [Athelia psychrophila]|uniref:N-terminal of MaoC-like dehydratase domain-containing protein n=1 Tax=Athelia psychrophila TaxID=1759441 RepID=A0A166I166_9AGAM|nr:hypothetical protein FIBSPDRAFT_920084 [Fibularhizoctonia sp. CBS 109695]
MSIIRPITTLSRLGARRISTPSPSSLVALDAWITAPKTLTMHDTLSPSKLADLHITLPTRDGTHPNRPCAPPVPGAPLGYGHHLAFFHPRNPEAALRPDGTDSDFCPPHPFVRRMWAGGSMRWVDGHGLRVGEEVVARSEVTRVVKKGFGEDEGKGGPMVFVEQTIGYAAEGGEVGVVEGRSHVYLPLGQPGGGAREPGKVEGLPATSDFSFTFTPTSTTLFRFSALTFNGHHIHLDREYAQKVEGYPERLVHGPLTALMLLETTQFYNPDAKFAHFEYRARNPVVINSALTIHGAWRSESSVELWTVDEQGTIGMTGSITCK